MEWRDKLNELQAELYGKLINHITKFGNNNDVKYDDDRDLLYFKVKGEWISEREVDIWVVIDIADNLGIKCTYND